MPVLITGAAGFVGGHLAEALQQEGHEVSGISLDPSPLWAGVDIRDGAAVDALVAKVRPEWVFHLAAQSRAALSWREPALTYEVNAAGTHLLLDALRKHVPHCRVLIPASSDAYGIVRPEDCPIPESAPVKPVSPYGASKVAQEGVGHMFFQAFEMHVVITRSFMHIGPGQPSTFATAGWAREIALGEAGLGERTVHVGDLELAREFGDVRDIARAYILLLERGEPDEIYNVATGEARPLKDALRVLLEMAEVEFDVEIDPARIRPADPPLLEGDATKLRDATGWAPRFRLEDTLADVLDYWRRRVGELGTEA